MTGVRPLAKRILARATSWSGIARRGRARHRHEVLILTYHGVLPPGRPHHPYLSRNFVDRDVFAAHMAHLRQHYTPISLARAVAALRGDAGLPDHPAVVTFDDGFRNNYTQAYPVLREMNVPATIFLATGHIGAACRMLWTEQVSWVLQHLSAGITSVPVGGATLPVILDSPAAREESARALLRHLKSVEAEVRAQSLRWLEAQVASTHIAPDPERYAFLDWAEVEVMASEGLVEFGSHTVSHLLLATGTRGRVRQELADSRDAISARTGRPCTLFAYPNGTARDFTAADQADVQAAGYTCAASQICGFNDLSSDLYALRRFNIGRGHSPALFEAITAGVWPAGASA